MDSLNHKDGEFSTSSLFEEIKDAAKREGTRTFEQYRDIIDEIIEEKRIYAADRGLQASGDL